MLLLVLLICGALSQRLASSVLTVSGGNLQYDVKSAYFQDYQLIGSVTMLDSRSAAFGFSFVAIVTDADTGAGTCTIRTTVNMTSLDYNSLMLRFVLVSSAINLRGMEINVTGWTTIVPLMSTASWKGAIAVQAVLKGWSNLQSISSNFSVVGTNLIVASNISSGWLLYQVLLFRAADWNLSTGNITQTIPKMPSQIYGLVAAQINKTSIDCSGNDCSALMSSSSFCLMGSN